MPRNGAGALEPPPGIRAEPNATIRSAQFNAFLDDWVADGNAVRPLASGGTGAASRAGAQASLGVVPQNAVNDTEAGRLLINGAWGIGGQTAVSVPGDNCNLITRSGWYTGVANTTLNLPVSSGTFQIVHNARNATSSVQMAYQISGAMYRRFCNSGTWSSWRTIDEITAQGSNANGTYVKYASGRIECRATITFTSAISAAFMGAFRSPAQTWTFPTSFNDGSGNPDVFVTPSLGTAFSAVRISATTATQAFFAVTAISSQSSDSRTVSLYAVRF